MAADSTHDSDRIIGEAKRSLAVQRQGGTHRPVRSIGRESQRLKTSHLKKKLGRLLLAVAGIWFAASVIGVIWNGIGFSGLMIGFLTTLAAVYLFTRYPKLKVPKRADLNQGDAKQLVGRTELWLEAQRPALPAPAADLVGKIGVQLDALGLQLDGVDQNHPAAREVRSLVGETLPEMVDSYRKIPAHLRSEKRAGATPDEQLTKSLGKISEEIDHVTRQLADGALDDLAVRTRYLDYKYGDPDSPVAESA
ncbi:hypothetical protein [Tsuneonella mangrovi]|uniref:hypothetical protein n=1 Tax=Tsuneonella mangrovi TaxID=1982042 RepID=UPI000BA21455|nr:hypothetical protein [Tsuneonella mangrovi]